MAIVKIELTTKSVPALWAAIQQVSEDLSRISMTVHNDTVHDDPVETPPNEVAKRRQKAKRRGVFAQLVYRPSGPGGRYRKIAVEDSLRQNAMTLDQLMHTTTRRGTWQNALKMASTASAARWARTNGGAAVAAV